MSVTAQSRYPFSLPERVTSVAAFTNSNDTCLTWSGAAIASHSIFPCQRLPAFLKCSLGIDGLLTEGNCRSALEIPAELSRIIKQIGRASCRERVSQYG